VVRGEVEPPTVRFSVRLWGFCGDHRQKADLWGFCGATACRRGKLRQPSILGEPGGQSGPRLLKVTRDQAAHEPNLSPNADSAPLSAVEWAAITKRRSASSGAAAAGPDAGLDVRGEMRAQAELRTSRCARLGGVSGVITLSPECQPGLLACSVEPGVRLTRWRGFVGRVHRDDRRPG